MRNIYLTFLSILFTTLAIGQQKQTSFQSTVQAGLLEGKAGSAFQLGAMSGLKKNTWTASIGSGLDYYGVRSIPLYVNLQKNVFNKTKTPFLYAGAGHHFLWTKNELDEGVFFSRWGNRKLSGGLYYQFGLGYQVPALKSGSLFFAAGYSYKAYNDETSFVYPCLTGDCPEYKEKYFHQLRRLSITTGLRF